MKSTFHELPRSDYVSYIFHFSAITAVFCPKLQNSIIRSRNWGYTGTLTTFSNLTLDKTGAVILPSNLLWMEQGRRKDCTIILMQTSVTQGKATSVLVRRTNKIRIWPYWCQKLKLVYDWLPSLWYFSATQAHDSLSLVVRERSCICSLGKNAALDLLLDFCPKEYLLPNLPTTMCATHQSQLIFLSP